LETLFNFNNSFTVFVWLPIFQPLGPKGGHGPNGPMVNTLVVVTTA